MQTDTVRDFDLTNDAFDTRREKGIKNSELRIKNYSPRLTGLGLIIANDIVKAHGGSLELYSQPGQSVFTIQLTG